MTTLLTVCSPNLGIVDSWLPVLLAARREHRDWKIVLAVPEAWDKTIRPDGAALRMASSVADEVVVEVMPGDFRSVADFGDAARLVERSRFLPEAIRASERLMHRLVSLLSRGRSDGRLLAVTAGRVLATVGRGLVRARPARLWDRWMSGPVLVLYDVQYELADEVLRVTKGLRESARFSLSHGIGIPVGPEERAKGVARGLNTRVYAYGALHREYFLRAPELTDVQVVITGVPRHDPEARRAISALEGHDDEGEWAGSVLLVSRQASSQRETPGKSPRDWLPAGRKVAQLQAIHRVVCDQEGLRLLVSTHPKERDDGTIQRGLPAHEEGRTWRFTTKHPVVLAEHVEFAVVFSSSVAVDLLASGVPTIEFQDVSGASAYDGPHALRDEKGRILRTAQRKGRLVLPADHEEDLASQVRRVRVQRDEVVRELTSAYEALYSPAVGAVSRILKDLEEAIAERSEEAASAPQ